MKRRNFIQAAGLAAVLPRLAFAQEKYPSKPITWVCPYGAGGRTRHKASSAPAKECSGGVP